METAHLDPATREKVEGLLRLGCSYDYDKTLSEEQIEEKQFDVSRQIRQIVSNNAA